MKNDLLVALIPLRGGSKSIPNKNIKLIAGKPLCIYSIEAAVFSGLFNRIIISTDSFAIAEIIKNYNYDKVEVIMRPSELATDTASTESVMLHIAEKVNFDFLCTIQATSPLVQKEDFINAYQKLKEQRFDTLVTGVQIKRFFWTREGNPVNYTPLNRPRRQDFEGYIMENGAFYFTKREILLKYKCRLGGKIGVYEMDETTGIEIDEIQDWKIVEMLLLTQNRKNITPKINKIKYIVTDVDGTLTDAGMYYSAEGELLKKFNTRDARGLEMIRANGFSPVILTKENSEIVKARAKKLKIEDCFINIHDKFNFLLNFCKERKVTLLEIAYFGDDLNDLECMKNVGFAACPADAEIEIKNISHYISSFKGGKGAVRDICNYILETINNDTK